jgi:multiple sugar transport system permease protein
MTSAIEVETLAAESHFRTSKAPAKQKRKSADWVRSAALLVITAIMLVPVAAVIILSLSKNSVSAGLTLDNFSYVFSQTSVLIWLANSLQVALATVLVSILIGAPAGYVLSRARNRIVGGYAMTLFVVQALPVITAIIPLFILFAGLGLVDNLVGITIIYVGSSMSVATWMMAAYIDTIPPSLEEAAWMDGASVFGSFTRIVLRNSLPGVLSTAIFTFLLAWNDYLVATVFLRSYGNYTLPIGLESFFTLHMTDAWGPVMAVAVVMMLPPVVIFGALNRYFSVGGIAGSLAGR